MEFENERIENEYFAEIHKKIHRNADIADLYEDLYRDTGNLTYHGCAEALRYCCQWWDTEYYRLQQVKDIKRVNLCKNKFCFNCQSMLAIKRQSRFSSELDELYDDYRLCHMVVTVPNCSGGLLKLLIKRMYEKFKHLTRFLSGDKKIRGMDFQQYGYAGAVRGLEVNYKETTLYHPHFHCIIAFRKGLELEKVHVNQFSFDHGQLVRKFSDLEILLQKIWRLLIDGETVKRETIEGVKEGYSVIIDPIEKGEYHEVFKYACKGAFDESEGAAIYNEEVFRTLREALYSRRIIQGYGLLHNFHDEVGEILEEDLTLNYAKMVAQLRSIEEPVFKPETLTEIMREENCRYISKSNLKRLIIERMRRDKKGE